MSSPRRLCLFLLLIILTLPATAQVTGQTNGRNQFNQMVNANADFTIPDTVCQGVPVTITNTSTSASNYYWDFCVADIRQPPVGVNMGNGGGNFRMPVFMDYVFENGNYYGFIVNFHNPGLTRLDFGNSLLNTPTYHYLGTVGGVIPDGAEGIQVVKNEGKWYAIIVGGNPVLGTVSKVLKVEFGTNIANPTPTATDWGNIGNLHMPLDLHLFKDGSNWYGFTVNGDNNTFTRFNFGTSFDNPPTGVNFGSVGGLAYPTGIHVLNDNGQWRMFVTNGGNNSRINGTWSITRLDFGNSLLNNPVGVNLGNPGGFLKHPRDLTIMISCGQIVGYAVNGAFSTNDIVMFDFNGDLTSVPTFSSLGNRGNLLFPVSITKLFREGNDLYAFVVNVDNNTFTRIRFEGCDAAGLPPSTLQNPPPIVYSTPGTYGINLTTDVGLSTQDAICKPVVVLPKLVKRPTGTFEICTGTTIKLGTQTSLGRHTWSTGANGDSITVSSGGTYWVDTDYYGCVNRDSFEVVLKPTPSVDLGNDTTICTSSSLLLDVSSINADSYLWSTGASGPSITVSTSGVYSIVVDKAGCVAEDVIQVEVADLAFDFVFRQDVCDPLTVQFTQTGNMSTNPWWDFGDGNMVSNSATPLHHFNGEGNYTVRLAVTTGICTDTLSKTISVAVVPADIILTPDTTICVGATKLLRTLPSLSFCWTPNSYLDNSLLANPTTSTPVPVRYYFTAERMGDNLIRNGDFSLGNTGFLSDYNYSPGSGIPEGTFTITNNISSWHPNLPNCGDHTGASSNGNMLAVNGSSVMNAVVWKQDVSLQPNTNYAFSAWLQSLSGVNPAQLQFSINGVVIGPVFTAGSSACHWQEFYTTWNSGNLNSATIAIVNKNVAFNGNDFALDDISFAPVYIQRDSVNIDVSTPQVAAQPVSTVCTDEPVQLNASGAVSYVWDNVDFLDNANISNPIATVQTKTRFIVQGTNDAGCTANDTVWVDVFAKPDIRLSNDTSICKNSSVDLWISGGVDYQWSPVGTLVNPNTANPVASPTAATKYFVIVNDQFNCQFIDSVLVDFLPDPLFTLAGSADICYGDTIQLMAGGGDTYNWSPSQSLDNINIANPLASPASSTLYQVTITESVCGISETLSTSVNVLPLPNVSASRSNDLDCVVGSAILSANGARQYEWSPVETLNNPTFANPIATPRVTTTYAVKGTSADGCYAYDSVTVKVEAMNEGVYLMPNAFTPNGDGINDCFGVKYWGVVDKLELSIYNRWGERIFYSTNPGACWDGTYKGIKQDSGVYIYMIRASTFCSPEVFRKGTVTLIR